MDKVEKNAALACKVENMKSYQFYVITRVGYVGGGVEDRAAGLETW